MDLGITNEELRAAVIERAVEKLFKTGIGEEFFEPLGEQLERSLEARIKAEIEASAVSITDKIGTEEIGPRVQAMIDGLTFQKHSKWGEPKEEPKTWRELLVERAERRLVEPVNYQGKTEAEAGRYDFKKETTRIAWMVDRHIQHHIDLAMRAALLDANKKLTDGILTAVQQGLSAAAVGIKLDVKIPPR